MPTTTLVVGRSAASVGRPAVDQGDLPGQLRDQGVTATSANVRLQSGIAPYPTAIERNVKRDDDVDASELRLGCRRVTVANPFFAFDLGQETGTVWLDDVTVTQIDWTGRPVRRRCPRTGAGIDRPVGAEHDRAPRRRARRHLPVPPRARPARGGVALPDPDGSIRRADLNIYDDDLPMGFVDCPPTGRPGCTASRPSTPTRSPIDGVPQPRHRRDAIRHRPARHRLGAPAVRARGAGLPTPGSARRSHRSTRAVGIESSLGGKIRCPRCPCPPQRARSSPDGGSLGSRCEGNDVGDELRRVLEHHAVSGAGEHRDLRLG